MQSLSLYNFFSTSAARIGLHSIEVYFHLYLVPFYRANANKVEHFILSVTPMWSRTSHL